MRQTPLVVADLLPAGFEIEAVLRPEDAGANGPYRFLGNLVAPNIAEARDDRFVAAFDLYDQKRETVAYMVRVVTPGSFTMPGVVASICTIRNVRAYGLATIKVRSGTDARVETGRRLPWQDQTSQGLAVSFWWPEELVAQVALIASIFLPAMRSACCPHPFKGDVFRRCDGPAWRRDAHLSGRGRQVAHARAPRRDRP
jgi:hypothetical protein